MSATNLAMATTTFITPRMQDPFSYSTTSSSSASFRSSEAAAGVSQRSLASSSSSSFLQAAGAGGACDKDGGSSSSPPARPLASRSKTEGRRSSDTSKASSNGNSSRRLRESLKGIHEELRDMDASEILAQWPCPSTAESKKKEAHKKKPASCCPFGSFPKSKESTTQVPGLEASSSSSDASSLTSAELLSGWPSPSLPVKKKPSIQAAVARADLSAHEGKADSSAASSPVSKGQSSSAPCSSQSPPIRLMTPLVGSPPLSSRSNLLKRSLSSAANKLKQISLDMSAAALSVTTATKSSTSLRLDEDDLIQMMLSEGVEIVGSGEEDPEDWSLYLPRPAITRVALEKELARHLAQQTHACAELDKLIQHRTRLVQAHLESGSDMGAIMSMKHILKYKARKQTAVQHFRELSELQHAVLHSNAADSSAVTRDCHQRLQIILAEFSSSTSATESSLNASSSSLCFNSSTASLLQENADILDMARRHVQEAAVTHVDNPSARRLFVRSNRVATEQESATTTES